MAIYTSTKTYTGSDAFSVASLNPGRTYNLSDLRGNTSTSRSQKAFNYYGLLCPVAITYTPKNPYYVAYCLHDGSSALASKYTVYRLSNILFEKFTFEKAIFKLNFGIGSSGSALNNFVKKMRMDIVLCPNTIAQQREITLTLNDGYGDRTWSNNCCVIKDIPIYNDTAAFDIHELFNKFSNNLLSEYGYNVSSSSSSFWSFTFVPYFTGTPTEAQTASQNYNVPTFLNPQYSSTNLAYGPFTIKDKPQGGAAYFDGTSWTSTTPYRFNGTIWEPVQPVRFNGTAWENLGV